MNIQSITQPTSLINPTALQESTLSESTALCSEICAAGEPWMGRVTKGQTFRIVDLEGNQAVDTIFFNANNLEERYSPSHTISKSGQLYLGLGSKLYSSHGRVMAVITADTCGRHDTLGGACASESNMVRYALDKRPMHSCRDNFMTALTTFSLAEEVGLDVRDIGANINFFMNVPVLPNGELYFADGISGAGKYVELVAEMDLIVLISNCPQLNNPCNGYNPTPIKLITWEVANHG